MYFIAYVALVATLAAVVVRDVLQSRRSSSLPPGPSGKGIFGDNRQELSNGYPWKIFAMWQKQYGNVISLYLGRKPVIVLGTFQAAVDLLEKRGNIYSSRPRSIVAGEILSGGMRGVAMDYGPRWRNWKSLVRAGMGIEAAQEYKNIQSIESSILLRDLLSEKDVARYPTHFRRFAISIVFCIGYGLRVKSLDEKIVLESQRIDEYFSSVPGKFFVESWPALLHLPRFLQWFRWEPERQRAKDTKLYLSLMDDVKRRMELGTVPRCMATRAMEKQVEFGLTDIEIAYSLSGPFAAGVATTLASFEIFLLAMLWNPSVMKKAQAELDSLVGSERFPDFNDVKRLPYIAALLKETFRWKPIAPLGIPHKVTSDDVYEGMHIPKGSTIYANIQQIPPFSAMTQDEEMFPEPEKFLPERFLNNDDPRFTNYTLSFGFGRRFCPGIHIAQQSIYILVTRVLWAFDVIPAKNDHGNPILPSLDDMTEGLVARPRKLEYLLVPRRENLESTIAAEAERAELDSVAWT